MRVDFNGLRRSILSNYNSVVHTLETHLEPDGDLRMYQSEVNHLRKNLDELGNDLIWLQNLMHECPSGEEFDSYTFLEKPKLMRFNDKDDE